MSGDATSVRGDMPPLALGAPMVVTPPAAAATRRAVVDPSASHSSSKTAGNRASVASSSKVASFPGTASEPSSLRSYAALTDRAASGKLEDELRSFIRAVPFRPLPTYTGHIALAQPVPPTPEAFAVNQTPSKRPDDTTGHNTAAEGATTTATNTAAPSRGDAESVTFQMQDHQRPDHYSRSAKFRYALHLLASEINFNYEESRADLDLPLFSRVLEAPSNPKLELLDPKVKLRVAPSDDLMTRPSSSSSPKRSIFDVLRDTSGSKNANQSHSGLVSHLHASRADHGAGGSSSGGGGNMTREEFRREMQKLRDDAAHLDDDDRSLQRIRRVKRRDGGDDADDGGVAPRSATTAAQDEAEAILELIASRPRRPMVGYYEPLQERVPGQVYYLQQERQKRGLF